FDGRDVVVTGGTGALGAAVVAAFVEAGAARTLPWLLENEVEDLSYRDSKRGKQVGPLDLADERAVNTLFSDVPGRWASVHIAGGFAMAPVAKTGKAQLMQQIEINLVSCFLSCAAAVNAIGRTGRGGRIVNVASRPALEWRIGAGMAAYTATKAA